MESAFGVKLLTGLPVDTMITTTAETAVQHSEAITSLRIINLPPSFEISRR